MMSDDEILLRDKSVSRDTPSLFGVDDPDGITVYLSMGADPNEVRHLGETPLGEVSTVEAAEVLCRAGARVRGNTLNTPLHTQTHYEVCEFLLRHGADVRALNHFRQTPLSCAANAAIAELLLKHNAPVNHRDIFGRTALHEAKTPEMVRLLLRHGALVNALSRDKKTPMETAVFPEVIRELARHGGKVHPKRRDDLLHRAADLEILQLYLQNGASANMVDPRGRTALFGAVSQPERFALLVEYGCDVNARDHRGRTMAHYIRSVAELDFLYRQGIDLAVADHDGETVWSLCPDPAIRHYLEKTGIIFSCPTVDTGTPVAQPVCAAPIPPPIFSPGSAAPPWGTHPYEKNLPPDLKTVIAAKDESYFLAMIDIYADESDFVDLFAYLAAVDRVLCEAFLLRYPLSDSSIGDIEKFLDSFSGNAVENYKNILRSVKK